MRIFCWSIAVVCITCSGPHSPVAMSKELLPLDRMDVLLDWNWVMLERGFSLIPKPDPKLYALALKIAQSKGAKPSDFPEVHFYESIDEYRVELRADHFTRMKSLPNEFPQDIYIRLSKPEMKVLEVTGCEGFC